MPTSSQQLPDLLARSKLFSQTEANAAYARWVSETGTQAPEVEPFLKWLIGKRYLTEYQATLLGKGHTDGLILQQYRILERIGRGRMAGVYKAVHTLGHVVALKVLPPSRARKAILLARFQREARLALKLRHPNVVRAFQMGECGGVHFLVMEYLEGETVEEALKRRGQLPVLEAVRLVYQALLGLQHLHEQGLVHRDLKPSNLMVVPAGGSSKIDTTLHAIVKILDIGLGRELYDESAPEKPDDPQLTEAGVLLGTPDYMAPEQAMDAHSADVRSDIYSLGCVLFHALAGQPPFLDVNIVSQIILHASAPIPVLRAFNADVPDGLQQVLGWMMAKEPAQRYPTPERAAQALQVFLAGAPETINPDIPAPLRNYLNWLESAEAAPATLQPRRDQPPNLATERAHAGAGVAEPAALVPAQAAGKKVIPIGKPASPAAPYPNSARRATKRAKTAPPAILVGPDAKPDRPVDEYDAELVSLPAANQGNKYQLTVRDFLMIAVGAGGVLIAVFAGWLISRTLRH